MVFHQFSEESTPPFFIGTYNWEPRSRADSGWDWAGLWRAAVGTLHYRTAFPEWSPNCFCHLVRTKQHMAGWTAMANCNAVTVFLMFSYISLPLLQLIWHHVTNSEQSLAVKGSGMCHFQWINEGSWIFTFFLCQGDLKTVKFQWCSYKLKKGCQTHIEFFLWARNKTLLG